MEDGIGQILILLLILLAVAALTKYLFSGASEGCRGLSRSHAAPTPPDPCEEPPRQLPLANLFVSIAGGMTGVLASDWGTAQSKKKAGALGTGLLKGPEISPARLSELSSAGQHTECFLVGWTVMPLSGCWRAGD